MADGPLVLLSEAHRNAQEDLAEALAALIVALWRQQVRPGIPSDTVGNAWLAQVAPVVFQFRDRSALLAREFYGRTRRLADPRAPRLEPVAADPLDPDALLTSLTVTALIGMTKKIVGGMDPDQAYIEAETAAEGAGSRHALNGGRSYVRNAIERDPVALGFYRQTADGCCWFCAMLASRGIVYKGTSFDLSDSRFVGADSDSKVHDHCRCQMQGVYRGGQDVDDFNVRMSDMWENTGGSISGDPAAARAAFREAYEASLRTAA